MAASRLERMRRSTSAARQPRRWRERSCLVGLSIFAHILTAFGWSPSALLHGPLSPPQSGLQCRTSRVWISHSSSGDDVDREESKSHRRLFQGSIASLVTRVRRKNNLHHRQSLPPSEAETSGKHYEVLQRENELLRDMIRQLELENEYLQQNAGKIVIESFEGENKMREQMGDGAWFSDLPTECPLEPYGITMPGEEIEADMPSWCNDDDEQCPVEPTISFRQALRDRAIWLVGLLALQSCSGLILSRNELLLARHPVIIYFLTMLVGAGGNAGNQASVRVIRGLALGTLNERTQGQFLARELKMAASLCSILSTAGFVRAVAFRTPLPESIAVTSALALIVFTSICLGAVLPLLLKKLGADPAHSSTTIQVVMDILGVLLTVIVTSTVLDSSFGQFLVGKLTGSA